MVKFQIAFSLLLASLADLALSRCHSPSLTTVDGTFAQDLTRGPICSGDLIFEDKFDSFNLRKWRHEITLSGGGNWEFQLYLNNRSNSFVENGHLHIKPTLLADDFGEGFLSSGTIDLNHGSPENQCTYAEFFGCVRTGTSKYYLNSVKSARISTLESFSFKYGKLEVRAKLPAGDWLWPAIWLLPRYNRYSQWPSSGEIDVMESRGNKNLMLDSINIGTEQISSTLHWGPNYFSNQFARTSFRRNLAEGFDQTFHRYQLEWTPDHITFSVDDQVVGTVAPDDGGFWKMGQLQSSGLQNPWKGGTKMAPFDSEFYLVINLAVGGVNGFFPDFASNPGGKPWKNKSPTAYRDFWLNKKQWLPTWDKQASNFVVDYVRVYAI